MVEERKQVAPIESGRWPVLYRTNAGSGYRIERSILAGVEELVVAHHNFLELGSESVRRMDFAASNRCFRQAVRTVGLPQDLGANSGASSRGSQQADHTAG